MYTWRQNAKEFDRINKHRLRDNELLEHAFLHPNPTRRRNRAYDAYQARQKQFTQKWLERGSFFDSATETLNSLRPAWGDAEVERLLAQLALTGELARPARLIENVLQTLFDQLLSASQDPTEGQQKAPETQGREKEKAARTRERDEYKAECKRAGLKITDDDIGRAVKPNSKRPRDIVQKWRACDPRYEVCDPLIRRVFREKSHLRKFK